MAANFPNNALRVRGYCLRLGHSQRRFQRAGTRVLAAVDGSPHFQRIVSGRKDWHLHPRLASSGDEKDTLIRVGGVELEPVAYQLAHPARREWFLITCFRIG